MNPDGSVVTNLTNSNSVGELQPAWSPDGTKIAFYSDSSGNLDVFTMNADGSGQTNVTNNLASDEAPAWSPDGTKIAFNSDRNGNWEIYTMNPDGSGVTNLTNSPAFQDHEPDWSPEGAKIAFRSDRSGNPDVFTMNADGTGQTNVTNNPAFDGQPAWSPDGTKVAFASDRDSGQIDVFTMNADGTGITNLTNNPDSVTPDWQAINPAPYSHPVGASPLRVSLVPAFKPCETAIANGQHGQPLDFPSCSNPALASSTVQFGSNSIGFVRLVVCPSNAAAAFCNPTNPALPLPDVRFTSSIRDVLCRQTGVPPGCTAGQDYQPNTSPGPYTSGGNGTATAFPPCFPSASSASACIAGTDLTQTAELHGASVGGAGTPFEGRGVRITDSLNGSSGNDAATAIDIAFPVPLDCFPRAGGGQGSCGMNTTANALAPGVVQNGKAAVWQIGEVELKDSGPDGVRGNSDDELFATQGVFLP
jgi:hypothetical protein